MPTIDGAVAEQLAAEEARLFWQSLGESYQTRRARGRAIVNQVVRDGSGRISGALASVEGATDQPLLIDHGHPMSTGDVYLVENDGTVSVPQWRAVRRLESAAAIPNAGELITLPAPSGLELSTGGYVGAPGLPVWAWIFATWDLMDSALYGGQMDYELQYARDADINNPETQVVNYDQPDTTAALDVGIAETVITRNVGFGGAQYGDDFPYRGIIVMAGERVHYMAHTALVGDNGTSGTGADGSLTDLTKTWAVDHWKNFVLVDSGGTKFAITGNDAQVLYFSGPATSGAYTIYPAFTGCSRGYEGTTAKAHSAGQIIVSDSVGARFSGLEPGVTYNVRVRGMRFDGALSDWSNWQSLTTYLDDTAPAMPSNFAVESTPQGIRLTWDGPTLQDTPDLAGFYLYDALDATGTNERYFGLVGTRTETMVFVPHFNETLYYSIAAVDTSGNLSPRTAWLDGKKQPYAGVNLLPNADFHVASGGVPDYWRFYVYGVGSTIQHGEAFGMDGGPGVQISVPAKTGEASTNASLRAPYPLNSWRIHAEVDQPYTATLYFKTDYPPELLTFDSTEFGTAEGKKPGMLFIGISSHDGANTSTNASFVKTPKIISETGDGWKRVEFTVEADPVLWALFEGYYYLHFGIAVNNVSPDYALTVDIDRAQLELAGEASAWAAGAFAPPGAGLRIDPTGIIGPFLHINGAGEIASDFGPAADYVYDLGRPDRRWDTIRARKIIADEIEDMGGASHPPVTLDGSATGILDISTGQVLGFDSQSAGRVLASPSGGVGAPTFQQIQAAHILTAAPAANLTGSTANAEGSATSLARSDHLHAITTAAPTANLSVSSSNAEGAAAGLARADHSHAITSSSYPGAMASILASTSNGYLRLIRLGIGVDPAHALHVLSGGMPQAVIGYNSTNYLKITVDGNATAILETVGDYSGASISLKPQGDIQTAPGGKEILPAFSYDTSIGSPQLKYLAIHAAELQIDTLVAQDVMATIGGRILVGPTTNLARYVNTIDTTIYVAHNQMVNGDRVYLEARGRVEFMNITSSASSAPEEVDNPSFEDNFTGWSTFAGTGSVIIDTTYKHTGSQSAKLTAGSGGNTWINQSWAVAADERYRISFWYMDNNLFPARFMVYDVQGAEKIIPLKSLPLTGGTWEEFETFVTIPDGCTTLRVYLYTSGWSGTSAWFDDVSVRKAEYSYSVARNQDGTGANHWHPGDAITNTGQIGAGFIDIYSGWGVNAPALNYIYNYNASGSDFSENLALEKEWTFFPSSPAVGDRIYYGRAGAKFYYVHNFLGVAGSYTATLVWEYWDGNSWEAFTPDPHHNWQSSTGNKSKGWTDAKTPGWVQATTNGKYAYWIRVGISALSSWTTSPAQSGRRVSCGLNSYGPTIVGNIRKSLVFNDWEPGWAIGNMNSLYGIDGDYMGVGLGDYTGGNYLRYDENSGFRLVAGEDTILMDGDGLTFEAPTSASWQNFVKWRTAGTYMSGAMFATFHTTSGQGWTSIYGLGESTLHASAFAGVSLVAADGADDEIPTSPDTRVELYTLFSDDTQSKVNIDVHGVSNVAEWFKTYCKTASGYDQRIGGGLSVGDASINPGGGEVRMTADARIGGGLYVGSTGIDPSTGQVIGSGDFKAGNGLLVGGTSANPALGQVLLDQATNDDKILNLISTGDVNHGATALAYNTATFGAFMKSGDTTGGLLIRGLKDSGANGALKLQAGSPTDAESTVGASAVGIADLYATKISGTSWTNINTNGFVFSIRSQVGGSTRTLFLFDEDGEMFSDGVIGTGGDWDDWDDLALASDLSRLPAAKWDEMLKYNAEDFERAGLVVLDTDEKGVRHAYHKHKAMALFAMNCFREVHQRFQAQGLEIAELRRQLAQLAN